MWHGGRGVTGASGAVGVAGAVGASGAMGVAGAAGAVGAAAKGAPGGRIRGTSRGRLPPSSFHTWLAAAPTACRRQQSRLWRASVSGCARGPCTCEHRHAGAGTRRSGASGRERSRSERSGRAGTLLTAGSRPTTRGIEVARKRYPAGSARQALPAGLCLPGSASCNAVACILAFLRGPS